MPAADIFVNFTMLPTVIHSYLLSFLSTAVLDLDETEQVNQVIKFAAIRREVWVQKRGEVADFHKIHGRL
ncbi:hypothetical protein C8Q74DRAFT_1282612 [Fomes fomentarius]|nr:hypothetical protein C8Q74DRAFT_1282612 [Fomes fomentarius]